MKSLKIKKYLKIFSVVICSIFIFSNKASAYEFSYNNINFDTDEILLKIKNKYSSIDFENKYRFHFSYILDNKIYFVTHDAPDMYNLNFQSISNKEDIKPYDNEVIIAPGVSSNGYTWHAWHYVYYYTYDLSTGEEIISSSYGSSPSSRVRFANNNEKLDSESYEEFIERKVLYSNMNFSLGSAMNNESYYRPYDNENIENPLKYRIQFNNDVSPNLKQITFDFPKIALENNLKARIELGNWNNIIEEIPKFNNLKIVGYDLNNNEYDLSNDIGYGYETTDYLTSKQLDFSFILNSWANIPEEVIRIKIFFDFETFNNNYYFNVFDNFIEGTTNWSYIENFLVDYKKYTFPTGYDIAIIRSKNFSDLDSFYISDKIYFTSTEYNFNLKVYDFNNKLEKYNFTSLTQYLINDVYLKIPLEIDEENNIFPILTKAKENKSGTFYLKNDLFVQWYDSETGNILIENENEESFNNNNDLNISNEDKENIKPVEQDNQNSIYVFFNNFWKMFEKFGDKFNYITSCFSAWYFQLPETIQFFLCISFAFIIYKMLVSFIL